jgi:hypothetical protein
VLVFSEAIVSLPVSGLGPLAVVLTTTLAPLLSVCACILLLLLRSSFVLLP